MQIATSFARNRRIFGGLATADAHALAGAFEAKTVAKAQHLARQGDPDDKEYILLSGKMVSLIGDAEGREVCVGFYVGPCVMATHAVVLAAARDWA